MKYIILLSLLFSSCAFYNYGITSIPDGCDIESFRRSDGTMNYYITGTKCTPEVYRRVGELNGRK